MHENVLPNVKWSSPMRREHGEGLGLVYLHYPFSCRGSLYKKTNFGWPLPKVGSLLYSPCSPVVVPRAALYVIQLALQSTWNAEEQTNYRFL